LSSNIETLFQNPTRYCLGQPALVDSAPQTGVGLDHLQRAPSPFNYSVTCFSNSLTMPQYCSAWITCVHMHTYSFQFMLSMKLCCADDRPLKTTKTSAATDANNKNLFSRDLK